MIGFLILVFPLWYLFVSGQNHTTDITNEQRWNVSGNLFITQAIWLFYYLTRDTPLGFFVSLTWLPVIILIQELWFYTIHRFFHYNKWLFNNVHAVHHTVYDAFYAWHAHPAEHILLNIGSLAVPCMLIPINNLVLAVLIYGQAVTSIIGHTPSELGRYHHAHHINPKTRFGNIRLFDNIMGTD